MKNSRFQWSYDQSVLIDTRLGRLWSAHRDVFTKRYYFKCQSKDHWNGLESALCTRRYTALRSLMRLIAKEDRECAKPIKRMK